MEFHHVGGVADIEGGHGSRVEFAHSAKHHAVGEDFDLLARVQVDFGLGRHAEFYDEAHALEEALHQALEGCKVNLGGLVVERVYVEGACNGEGDEVRFVEARIAHVLAVALELALGYFEQANGTGAVLFVFGNALEKIREEAGRNHAESGLACETQAQAFVQAHRGERLANLAVQDFNRRELVRLHLEGRQRVRDVVEPDETGDFFDEVHFAFEAGAESRNPEGDRFGVLLHDFESDTREVLFDVGSINLHADNLFGAGRAERDLVQVLLVVVARVFDGSLENAATGDFLNHGAGVAAVFVLRGKVDFAFEAVAGIGRDAEALGLLADDGRVEPGAFEEHVLGGIDNFGFDAAHDAGNAGRTVAIANHEVVFNEFMGGVVDGFDLFALHGAAHLDLVAMELVHVEAVERLAHVHQNEVRDVDHVVDAVHAYSVQELGEPSRRLFNLHVLDDAAHITGATATGNHFKGHGRACCFGIFLKFVGKRLERTVELGGKFTSDTAVAEGIRAVRGHIQFEAYVVEAEAHERSASGDAVVENHDSTVVVRKADFVFGANHAETFDAADLGFLHLERATVRERKFRTNRGEHHGLACSHVRGSANNLDDFLAVVHGRDVQMVAVRVGVASENLCDNELFVDLARFFHAFDFEADGGKSLGNFFRRFRKINVTSEPIQRNFHLSIL